MIYFLKFIGMSRFYGMQLFSKLTNVCTINLKCCKCILLYTTKLNVLCLRKSELNECTVICTSRDMIINTNVFFHVGVSFDIKFVIYEDTSAVMFWVSWKSVNLYQVRRPGWDVWSLSLLAALSHRTSIYSFLCCYRWPSSFSRQWCQM